MMLVKCSSGYKESLERSFSGNKLSKTQNKSSSRLDISNQSLIEKIKQLQRQTPIQKKVKFIDPIQRPKLQLSNYCKLNICKQGSNNLDKFQKAMYQLSPKAKNKKLEDNKMRSTSLNTSTYLKILHKIK
ncbi:hypothetical protein pb186bvf_001231 [Paramecium bursaria]